MKNKKQKFNPYDTPNTRRVMGDYYVELMGYLLGYRDVMPILKFDLVPKLKIEIPKQNNNK